LTHIYSLLHILFCEKLTTKLKYFALFICVHPAFTNILNSLAEFLSVQLVTVESVLQITGKLSVRQLSIVLLEVWYVLKI